MNKSLANATKLSGLASIANKFSHSDKIAKMMGSAVGFAQTDLIDPDNGFG